MPGQGPAGTRELLDRSGSASRLSLNFQSGVISGTPTATADSQTYTVTGSNAAGSTQASLNMEIREPLHAPTNLSYTNPAITTS